jgi:hypothetical protein
MGIIMAGLEVLDFLFYNPDKEPMVLTAQEILGGRREERTTIQFDAVLEPSINSSVGITSHPIDNKADVIDHVSKEQTTVKIKAVFVNNPENIETVLKNNVIGAISNFIPNELTIPANIGASFMLNKIREDSFLYTDRDGEKKNRAQIYWEMLNFFMENGYVLNLYTRLKVYDNLLIKSLSTKLENTEYNALVCDIEFVQINIAYVDNREVKIETTNIEERKNKSGGVKKANASKKAEVKTTEINKSTVTEEKIIDKKKKTLLRKILPGGNEDKSKITSAGFSGGSR